MQRFRRWSRKEGFTLIEVMVAAVVFSVGMLGILKLLHISILGYRYAKDMSAANAILQEQFEMITHKRVIDILEPTAKTIDALRKLNLPSGVYVELK